MMHADRDQGRKERAGGTMWVLTSAMMESFEARFTFQLPFFIWQQAAS
jgi:hypothetical protein